MIRTTTGALSYFRWLLQKKELAINRLSSLRHCSAAALLAIARSRGRGDDGGGGNSYVSLPYPCAYQASSSIIIIIRTGKEEEEAVAAARGTQNKAVMEETNARAACVQREREGEREDTDIRTEKMGRWVDERGCNVAIVFCCLVYPKRMLLITIKTSISFTCSRK